MMGSLSAILSSTTASEQEINDALTNALFSMEKMSSSSSPSIELLEYLFVLLQRFISAEITSKTSRLLAYILPTVPFATIVEKYKAQISAGLQYPDPQIQIITINSCIGKGVETEEGISLLKNSSFVHELISCISDKDLSVANAACRVMKKLASRGKVGLEILFSPSSIALYFEHMSMSEEIKFRFFELFADISTFSADSFSMCHESGVLKEIFTDLKSNDIAASLNAVEIFSQMLEKEYGFDFLEEAGVFNYLAQIAGNPDGDDIELVLMKCGVWKFFGRHSVCNEASFKVIDERYRIIDCLHRQLVDSSRLDLKDAVVVAIGNIGSSKTGLTLLHASGCLKSFMELYNAASGPFKLTCLQTMSCLLSVCGEKGETEIDDITCLLFKSHRDYPHSLKSIMKLCSSALEEVSIAAYSILKGVSLHGWGLNEMNHPDFKAFLLDRKLEKTKIGKEWRFYLVQSILVNTSSRNIFPEAFLHSLDKYVREGPYYLDPTMSVAFQST